MKIFHNKCTLINLTQRWNHSRTYASFWMTIYVSLLAMVMVMTFSPGWFFICFNYNFDSIVNQPRLSFHCPLLRPLMHRRAQIGVQSPFHLIVFHRRVNCKWGSIEPWDGDEWRRCWWRRKRGIERGRRDCSCWDGLGRGRWNRIFRLFHRSAALIDRQVVIEARCWFESVARAGIHTKHVVPPGLSTLSDTP